MNRTTLLGWVTALLVITGAATAQVDYEPFTQLGTPIPGWTDHVAAWTVKDIGGGDLRAESTGTASHSFLVRTNGVADMGVIEALLTGVTATCNGGVVFRFDASAVTGVRAYGASSGGMNMYKVLMIEAPGVTRQYISITNRTKNLLCRLLVQGAEARAQFDEDPVDGKWDYELNLSGVAAGAKPYGVYAWHGSYADNVKFFDAAIFRRSTFGASNIGTAVPMDLYAPTANAPYVLVPSMAPAMIPLPNGWFIPITPDTLSAAAPVLPSIFTGFAGTLDGQGMAQATLNIPNIPALAGIVVYVSGAVVDTRLNPPFLHLFNDEQIVLQ